MDSMQTGVVAFYDLFYNGSHCREKVSGVLCVMVYYISAWNLIVNYCFVQ